MNHEPVKRHNYTYGPVPSRRLGRSLGVSPIPAKACSYTCIYCQLGRTTDLTSTRRSFFPKEDVLAEILLRGGESQFDYVTFAGDGEPTLSKDLGWLLRATAEQLNVRTAVITNGSLLSREDVRLDLMNANVVMPTLDAGNERTFRAVNRPHRSITFDLMLRGLTDFRREYRGQIWLEVMLVRGVNDSEEELLSLKRAADAVGPEQVYIVTPIRPPAEAWVAAPSPEAILTAQTLIGGAVPLVSQESGEFGLSEFSDARQAILETGSRHPLRQDQAREIESAFGISGIVDQMLLSGELSRTEYRGTTYLLPGHFIRGQSNHE